VLHEPFDHYRAAVIGTGMMGPGIAATLALSGIETCLISRNPDSARQGLRAAREAVLLLESNELATPAAANHALEHLVESADLDSAVANVDLVIESAPEDMAFKQDLFAHLDAITPPDCILASNTSGLSITAIASKCARPERVATTHFWNPPHLMPLVEIVKGERTSDAVVAALRDLLLRCGKTPVLVRKDRPGQLGNRLQIALQREAMHIVAEGIADVEDVDTAAKCGFGLRLPVYGMFEHMDAVGLDLAGAVVDYITRDLNNETGMPEILRRKIDNGELGARTGSGFYDWTTKDIEAVKQRRNRFLIEFLKRDFGH
jgi:3-hydroxybutyryl-CoA dehydrogenase